MSEKRKTLKEFYETKVKDIMNATKSDIPHLNENAEVSRVLFSLNNRGHVWVMDNQEPTRLVGVITESDTIALFSPPLTSTQSFDNPDHRSLQFEEILTAKDIMSKKPVTISPDENIRDILVKMKEQKIKHLPVVDEYGQLNGEVSLSILIQVYLKQQTETDQIS
jgi:CBS domain-containing protein